MARISRVVLLVGIVSIVIGLFTIFRHKRLAREGVRFQYEFLNMQFDERAFQVVFLVVGIGFVGMGIAAVLYTLTQ